MDNTTKVGKKVLDCRNKGLKIAKQCMDPLVQVNLFVEILNHYVLFYEAGCENTTIDIMSDIMSEIVSEIVKLVWEELAGLEQGDESEQIGQHFNNTVEHMKVKRDTEQPVRPTPLLKHGK